MDSLILGRAVWMLFASKFRLIYQLPPTLLELANYGGGKTKVKLRKVQFVFYMPDKMLNRGRLVVHIEPK